MACFLMMSEEQAPNGAAQRVFVDKGAQTVYIVSSQIHQLSKS